MVLIEIVGGLADAVDDDLREGSTMPIYRVQTNFALFQPGNEGVT